MQVYIPSYLGDVSLSTEGDNTVLMFDKLTPLEQKAIDKFLKHYKMTREGSAAGKKLIPATLAVAHKQFINVFRAGKPVLNAVKTKDGKLEIVQEFTAKEGEGVTVEKPPRGCPVPVWEQKEAKAIQVLQRFLLPQQLKDFMTQRAFIAQGNYSGLPYLLTSRWNPSCVATGVLWSLPGRQTVCASLLNVPPAEELLAMKISVECDELNFVGSTLLQEFSREQAARPQN